MTNSHSARNGAAVSPQFFGDLPLVPAPPGSQVDRAALHLPERPSDLASEVVPLPKAAAGRNLIEGCWKLPNQRALVGHECRSVAEVEAALHAGVAD